MKQTIELSIGRSVTVRADSDVALSDRALLKLDAPIHAFRSSMSYKSVQLTSIIVVTE